MLKLNFDFCGHTETFGKIIALVSIVLGFIGIICEIFFPFQFCYKNQFQ